MSGYRGLKDYKKSQIDEALAKFKEDPKDQTVFESEVQMQCGLGRLNEREKQIDELRQSIKEGIDRGDDVSELIEYYNKQISRNKQVSEVLKNHEELCFIDGIDITCVNERGTRHG